jgi:hypothetical protein
VLVLGHDEPHAWKRMKGSGGAHVQRRGAHSLPFVTNPFEVGAARQPKRTREGAGLRRQRTWTGAGR